MISGPPRYSRRRLARRLIAAAALPWPGEPLPAASPCRFVHADVEDAGSPAPVSGFLAHMLEPRNVAGILLKWPREVSGATGFGFAFGGDYREYGSIHVTLAHSGRLLAALNVSMAPRFDPYFTPLAEQDARAASHEGIRLRAPDGQAPRFLLSATPNRRLEAPALHPFLLLPGSLSPLEEYFRRMRSLDVTQDFDWRAGCVAEGLYALRETRALRRYLRLFLDESSPTATAPLFHGVEQTLPVAAIARLFPRHPSLAQARLLWQQRRAPEGFVQDGNTIVAEANYTAAYPMAVLAATTQNDALRRDAVAQLRAARERLVDAQGNLYLRQNEKSGARSYLGWARGVAWYVLGLAATLDALPPAARPEDLRAELRRALAWALRYQRDDGLWCGFLPEPEVAPDTSGSAGIAAALLIASRLGVAEPAWTQAARRTLEGCLARLNPLGFLTGVSQSNKREGGEEFQRSPHRVSMPFAMGLLGVLLAEARKAPRRLPLP